MKQKLCVERAQRQVLKILKSKRLIPVVIRVAKEDQHENTFVNMTNNGRGKRRKKKVVHIFIYYYETRKKSRLPVVVVVSEHIASIYIVEQADRKKESVGCNNDRVCTFTFTRGETAAITYEKLFFPDRIILEALSIYSKWEILK